eukprot:Gb_21223 [translate_table: standard]
MENQQLCDTTETSQSCEDRILAELIAMGFELPAALEAIGAVGQSLSDAVEFILAGNPLNACEGASGIRNDQTNLFTTYSGEKCSAGGNLRSCNSIHATKQHLITEKFKPTGRRDKSITFGSCSNSPIGDAEGNATFELLKMKRTSLPCPTDSGFKSGFTSAPNDLVSSTLLSQTKDLRQPSLFPGELCAKTLCADPLQEADSKWESKAEVVLQKYFGYTALKSFQKEALQAWAVHQDCLVLAATGSGKSLCFQLPALMSGKVVVVISPLISLMHDQCLKLARHGVSACFLGSGQVDKSVEDRAMAGLYDIIYLCPETLLRVVGPLQKLVENRGIALFAIDEVHCVSKWGHDFRPDYRRLSVLKEKFKASNFKSVEYDIPIMALTATATHRVREDIMNCLGMKADVKIVLTSFFRPNLRFSVHHSKTSWLSSYEMDFQELITVYTQEGGNRSKRGVHLQKPNHDKDWVPVREEVFESDETSSSESESYEENTDGHDHNDRTCSIYEDVRDACGGHQMTVEYLEDEHDEQLAEDFDCKNLNVFTSFCGSKETLLRDIQFTSMKLQIDIEHHFLWSME